LSESTLQIFASQRLNQVIALMEPNWKGFWDASAFCSLVSALNLCQTIIYITVKAYRDRHSVNRRNIRNSICSRSMQARYCLLQITFHPSAKSTNS